MLILIDCQQPPINMSSNKIESGVQLFSRLRNKPVLDGINPKLFPDGGPHQNQIVEISGDCKEIVNDMLVDFIVKCILPKNYNSEWKGSEAVLINSEHHINLLKIIKIMEIHLKKAKLKTPIKDIIEDSLKRLFLYNCYNPEELKMCFYNLERLIYSYNISLIVVDNISAYYWIAKFNSNLLSYHQHAIKHFDILYNVIKSTSTLLIFARNKKSDDKGKSLPKTDYQIEIQSSSNVNEYSCNILNFEKDKSISLSFTKNVILEF